MSWRAAFILQARSDNEIRRLLNKEKVEYSHQLHYLQMTTEKLAKGMLTSPSSSNPPTFTHSAFVRCLQVLKGRPEIRRQLGYDSPIYFREFIDSVLPFADRVEKLAPSFAGGTQPNPEYPWQNKPQDPVVVPAHYNFPEFDPRSHHMNKLVSLIEILLRFVN